MSPGFRDHPTLPRFRSGSKRHRKINIPGVDRDDRPLRILLVDDAPVNLAVCSRLLGRMGCQVDPATSGEYAVAMFRDGCPRAKYDLVLLDMNMPGMDGKETSRTIREIEASLPEDHTYRSRPVPILMLVSHDPGDKAKDYHSAGINDFLYKPFVPEVVCESLAKWIPIHV